MFKLKDEMTKLYLSHPHHRRGQGWGSECFENLSLLLTSNGLSAFYDLRHPPPKAGGKSLRY